MSTAARRGRTQRVSTHASWPRARSSSCSHIAARRSASVHAPRPAKVHSPWTTDRMRAAPYSLNVQMDAIDLAFAGAARQAELIRSREVSARELAELYLERIARLDPQLNAYRVTFAERALAEADQADARAKGGDKRPLLGVPVAIKDDCDVAGETTAYGSDAHGGPVAADAEVVRRLRTAGAVIIGKTHVPEMTITPWTESPTFGVTRNPWDPHRTPGGSSGGSAAAVAAGLAGAALGSDGAGSIRIPAGCCGLFGLKAQNGRVPTAPAVEPWHGMSAWGPITRRVADSAVFYDAVKDGGPSFADAAAREPGRLRIAVSVVTPPLTGVQADAEQVGAVNAVADTLRELRPRGDRARDQVPAGRGRQRARALPARDRRHGALDAAAGAPVAAHARLHADRQRRPARRGRARSRGGGRRCRAAQPGLRRRRRRGADADVHPPPAGGRRVRGAAGGVGAERLDPLRPLLRRLQPHRSAGGVGAGRVHARRLPARRPARRPAGGRAGAARDRRAARGRARMARPAAAAGA